MSLDLVSLWTLAFFGAIAVGGLVGWLIGSFTRFELGLAIGLLIPGVMSLGFTAVFLRDHWVLTDSATRVVGRVVAVEDRPDTEDGDVTTPVAVVEYATPDGRRFRADSGGGSGWAVDDEVVVVYDPDNPAVAQLGIPERLRGGAIASLLFGTFPTSAGVFFLCSWWLERRPEVVRPPPRPGLLTVLGNVLIFGGILWTSFSPSDDVAVAIMEGFGVVTIGLWTHVAWGIRAGATPQWWMGMAVLAVNFSAWVGVLWVLTRG